MAIQYRLLQNKIKGSANYGKFYAHTVKRGTISLEQIEEMSLRRKSSAARTVQRREVLHANRVCGRFKGDGQAFHFREKRMCG